MIDIDGVVEEEEDVEEDEDEDVSGKGDPSGASALEILIFFEEG